ncbi:MAG: DUF6607 family protein [Pseudomonadota bacterium]
MERSLLRFRLLGPVTNAVNLHARRLFARYLTGLTAALSAIALLAMPCHADERQYTFSWQFEQDAALKPRGGTTRGGPLTLATSPSAAYQRLAAARDAGKSAKVLDRLAILAMAGDYRASFDFLETIGYTADYNPSQPYQSWGTERVYVLVDEPERVELQHVLVMQMRNKDGSLTEPMAMKHWRQAWRYEDRDLHTYRGARNWEHRRLSRGAARSRWTQAVFQVDDSPRYEASGRWTHDHGVSSWTSDTTWRPLPRREHSVRKDYQVLIGTNTHIINPTGWVQRESNRKVVLDADGQPLTTLAAEEGLNRYERLDGFDFAAGDLYLQKTGSYWAAVRDYWDTTLDQRRDFRLASQVDGMPLFAAMFAAAEAGSDAASPASAIAPYLELAR